MSLLWTEKYRPKTIEDISVPPHLKEFLKNAESFPHLLLYGPPGTGKTSFALLLAGKTSVLELNASDDRGIGVVRGKIKSFASTGGKVIILDECENLTPDAQQCLRRVIEDFNCRFIFITNYLNKIISPLRSRLLKIRFDLFDTSNVLIEIAQKEKIEMNMMDLFKLCNFDLRRAINAMQGMAPLPKKDYETMQQLLGIIPETVIEKFWSGDEKFVSDFLRESYSVLQLIMQLEFKGTDTQKAEFSMFLGNLELKALQGCNDELVLDLLWCKKAEIYSKF